MPPLPAGAEQVAREMEYFPSFGVCAPWLPPAPPMSLEELSLRQQMTEAVLAAALDVDETIAEISYEQDRVTAVQDRLASAKNNKANTLTLAGTLVGSGTSAIGTGMGLNNSTAKAGDWLQVFGGTGASFYRFWRCAHEGERPTWEWLRICWRPFWTGPENSSVYRKEVWKYLNTAPVDNPRVHVPDDDSEAAGISQDAGGDAGEEPAEIERTGFPRANGSGAGFLVEVADDHGRKAFPEALAAASALDERGHGEQDRDGIAGECSRCGVLRRVQI